jgi:hypothetical protein
LTKRGLCLGLHGQFAIGFDGFVRTEFAGDKGAGLARFARFERAIADGGREVELAEPNDPGRSFSVACPSVEAGRGAEPPGGGGTRFFGLKGSA